MEQQIHQILEMAVTGTLSLLALVVTGLLSWGATSLKQWLDSKAHTASFSCATEKLATLSADAVAEVEQTLVRQLKAEMNWNVTTAREARDTAVEIVKRQLGERGLRELQGCLGLALRDIESIIRSKIEASVSRSDTGTGTGPVVSRDA